MGINLLGGKQKLIAIGNGEKCPFCDKIMENFKIDGVGSTEHLTTKHSKEFTNALFGGKEE